jgi:prolyl 4-hydroxylase
MMDPQIEKNLRCRYITNGVAFLKLQPIKEEEAYLNPRILIYHDVITDKEIEIVKKMAQPRVSIFLTLVQFP